MVVLLRNLLAPKTAETFQEVKTRTEEAPNLNAEHFLLKGIEKCASTATQGEILRDAGNRL